jgi:hypothetical protein
MTDSPDLLSQAEPHQTAAEAERVPEVLQVEPVVESLPAIHEGAPQSLPARHQPAPLEGPGAVLAAIVELAKDPAVDVSKLDALLKMQERMTDREAEVLFNKALMRLPPIHVTKRGTVTLESKDGKNKGQSYKFAKWDDMAPILEPLLFQEGFRLMFNTQQRTGDGGGLIITGTLLHEAGHSKSASMPLPLDTGFGRNNLQSGGSTLSYGKRYTTEMLLNIVRDDEDDDGKSGGKPQTLSDEQVDELLNKLREANRKDPRVTVKWFLENHTDAPEIEQVPAVSFVRLMNRIDAIARRAKQEG